jgi:hypothetical protein
MTDIAADPDEPEVPLTDDDIDEGSDDDKRDVGVDTEEE